jgi:hypothetical protein
MKPIVKNSSLIFALFLMLYTCAKESEEINTESEEENTIIEKLDSKKALTEWQKFDDSAVDLLAITNTNLKSLLAKSENTENEIEKEAFSDTYSQSKSEYLELKNRLTIANANFKKELSTYNRQTEIKYRTFKNRFLHDILELNNNLEDLVEEINAD